MSAADPARYTFDHASGAPPNFSALRFAGELTGEFLRELTPRGAAAITAGWNHTCALTTGRGALCWGDDAAGDLGNNSTTQSNVPVAVTGLSSGVAVIAAGGYHTCAVTTASGAQCWGGNDQGQLGDDSTTKSLAPVAVF